MMKSLSKLVASARQWMKKTAKGSLLALWLNIAPAPCSRPRVARNGGVFYGKNYTKFTNAAKKALEEKEGPGKTDKPLMVMVENIVQTPKTGSKYSYPKAQGDVDNFGKSPLDAMTHAKKFWEDDDQIVGLMLFKRFTDPGEEAGVNVEYFELEDKQ